ncbi:type II toxin-antitoxin system VapC family toxin [Pendulispora brunnea]|uniref:Type II toxin-antitoxin system VapC family toxin n=1 Tax=Pendulispora brunnea TaxID=2905690 RepID=A0ABZ2K478_9BACT
MRLLLDTHVLIFGIHEPMRLPSGVRAQLAEPENDRFFSIASIWEMAIKISLGKLEFPIDLDEVVDRFILKNSVQLLPIEPEHAMAVASLPWHHRDPFDRLLVAQASAESLTLVSADASFEAYDCTRLWD